MSRGFRPSPSLFVFWAFLATVVGGCAGRGEDLARFVPEPEPARRAVVATLTAWQAGQTPAQVQTAGPSARLVDNQHRPQQRLKRFEVLGEVAADNGRGFAVRLTLEDPDEEQLARYLVYGQDPLWVHRQEDLDLLAHWEHTMDPPVADTSPSKAESSPPSERKPGTADPGATPPSPEPVSRLAPER